MPPPPTKRIKRPATVLDEDIYTNALSEIIARDFFPGLLETQLKQEYLEALDSKNKEWITSSRRKLADLATGKTQGKRFRSNIPTTMTPRPGDTPTGWGGDTPMSVISTDSTSTEQRDEEKGKIPDVSALDLQSFQTKYTSEDNESFNTLLDKQNAKKRDRYRWIWSENKIPSARQIAHHREETKRITARGENPDTDDQQGEGKEGKLIKTDLDARPARPDAWAARAGNQLMFLPSSIEDTHETIQQRKEAESRAAPKRVLYQNTRLQDPAQSQSQPHPADVPPSPSISAIQDAIAGRPRLNSSEAGGYSGGETPRVNGYAFVDDDESPATQAEPEEDLSILGASSSTPNPFQIPEARKREALHHRMVDRVAHKKRVEKASREAKTPTTPRFASSPRLDFGMRTPAGAAAGGKPLTPAGQMLLQRVGSTPRQGDGRASGSGLRNMWTPTPKRK